MIIKMKFRDEHAIGEKSRAYKAIFEIFGLKENFSQTYYHPAWQIFYT